MVPPGGGALAGPTQHPSRALARAGRTAAGTQVTQVSATSLPVIPEPGPGNTGTRESPPQAQPRPLASLRTERSHPGQAELELAAMQTSAATAMSGPGARARPRASRAAGVLDGEAWWKRGLLFCTGSRGPRVPDSCQGSRAEKLLSLCEVKAVLALLRINGTDHVLPRVAELQHHLSHLQAVLLLQLSKATVQRLIFQSQGANSFTRSCRSVLSGCELLSR